jgi:glucokinase
LGLASLGVAVAGPVDAFTGTLFDPPNLRALDGVSLKACWEDKFGLPVKVGNDANLAALGEYFHGAGKEAKEHGNPPSTLVYMTVSTGIGGGVVERGQMFLGTNGLAVEVGHMVIDQSTTAPICQCGNRGCLESMASGTAIGRLAKEGYLDGSQLAATESRDITSEVVFQAAARGDTLAAEVLEGVVLSLGVGLTNILHLYNPDLVVLGGGVSRGLDQLELLPEIRAIIDARAMSEKHKEFQLVVSKLGDSPGMIGAAAMAWEDLR